MHLTCIFDGFLLLVRIRLLIRIRFRNLIRRKRLLFLCICIRNKYETNIVLHQHHHLLLACFFIVLACFLSLFFLLPFVIEDRVLFFRRLLGCWIAKTNRYLFLILCTYS